MGGRVRGRTRVSGAIFVAIFGIVGNLMCLVMRKEGKSWVVVGVEWDVGVVSGLKLWMDHRKKFSELAGAHGESLVEVPNHDG